MREDLKELLEKAYPKGFFVVGLMDNDRGDVMFWDREGDEYLNEIYLYWNNMMDMNADTDEENEEDDNSVT